MKLMDKLKNALFEEEYVEVEEKPKKIKPVKEKKIKEETPIAKKIVLPEREEVKITNHSDFEEDEEYEEKLEEEPKKEKGFPIISDSEFMVEEEPVDELEEFRASAVKQEEIEEPIQKEEIPVRTHEKPVEIPEKKNIRPSIEERQHKLYGMDEIPIPEPEYGTYDKDDKTYFRPSPIISPIYGILDKNYTKEEISPKREIRIASSFSREKINVDDVRRKAYGNLSNDIEDEIEQEDESNLMDQELVDLSEDETPEIKKVTIEDAEEYYNDLGLEYNIDYKDKQKDKETSSEEIAPVVDKEEYEAKLRKEQEEDNNIDEDDNLFDLIDSMYEKE